MLSFMAIWPLQNSDCKSYNPKQMTTNIMWCVFNIFFSTFPDVATSFVQYMPMVTSCEYCCLGSVISCRKMEICLETRCVFIMYAFSLHACFIVCILSFVCVFITCVFSLRVFFIMCVFSLCVFSFVCIFIMCVFSLCVYFHLCVFSLCVYFHYVYFHYVFIFVTCVFSSCVCFHCRNCCRENKLWT